MSPLSHLRTVALLVALAPAAPARAQPPGLPLAVTNNAVAEIASGPHRGIYSFLGLDSTKRWSGVTTRAFVVDPVTGKSRELRSVPGARGRLAATAQAWRGRIYLFGGYTVDSAGTEHSLPNVDVYDPGTDSWSAAAPTPIAVDDAVSGVYRDSLIYLVSGWHDTDNVTAVQVYDPATNRWTSATPVPGVGVFGHAGAIAGSALVFVDGVQTGADSTIKFAMKPQAWLGSINPDDPMRINWTKLPPHPGPALFRAAAGVCGSTVVFAGGTETPYNYDGMGYGGRPAAPRDWVFGWDLKLRRWQELALLPAPSMDHRGLAIVGGTAWVIGGMRAGQTVTAAAQRVKLSGC